MMEAKTAIEFDDFLVHLKAAVSTLFLVHEYFFNDEPISKQRAIECSQALFTVNNHISDMVESKMREVEEALNVGKKVKA